MNDDTLFFRLAPVTDEQAAAMVSRQALGELAEEIIRTVPDRPSAVPGPAKRQAPDVDPPPGCARRRGGACGRSGRGRGRDRLGRPASRGAKTAANATPGARNVTPGAWPKPTPTASTRLAAWTVTENPDGTLKVTVREMENASGLQATLRADGARVVVTASLAWPAGCVEWRAGDYRMGDQVVQSPNRTGAPLADGTVFLIRPSAIPARALLWIGISQTGNLKGVPGPARQASFGYLTPSKACSGS